MNSDIEVSRTVAGVPVPIRIRPHFVLLVALGGAAGTLVREAITDVAPSWETLSAGTVAVNILGPFMLGLMLQSLAVGTETPGRRTLRLLIGTGFLGAFTSYAQLAVDTVVVTGRGLPWLAAGYAVLTVVAGVAATGLGIVIAARAQKHRAAHAARVENS